MGKTNRKFSRKDAKNAKETERIGFSSAAGRCNPFQFLDSYWIRNWNRFS